MGGTRSSPPANAKRKPIPLPPQVDGDISIHPLFLSLDLALYPAHAHRQVATAPPLPSMTLVCLHTNGDWDICTVHGSGERGHVLVDDVLCGIRALLARQSALVADYKGRLVKRADITDAWELVLF